MQDIHLMSLLHVGTFYPEPVSITEVPNIMMTNFKNIMASDFYDRACLGFIVDDLQKKLIHSYIAGNNSYEAFVNSNKDLLDYAFNLARDNEFELVK